MQAGGLIKEVGHAVRLHSEMTALVRHRWVWHAVHRAMWGHHKAGVLAVLSRHVAEPPVALDDTGARRGGGTVKEVVEESLRVLPRAEDTHLGCLRDLSWEMELDCDKRFGLVNHHGLAARPHHTLPLP